jgi:hypothetical protein
VSCLDRLQDHHGHAPRHLGRTPPCDAVYRHYLTNVVSTICHSITTGPPAHVPHNVCIASISTTSPGTASVHARSRPSALLPGTSAFRGERCAATARPPPRGLLRDHASRLQPDGFHAEGRCDFPRGATAELMPSLPPRRLAPPPRQPDAAVVCFLSQRDTPADGASDPMLLECETSFYHPPPRAFGSVLVTFTPSAAVSDQASIPTARDETTNVIVGPAWPPFFEERLDRFVDGFWRGLSLPFLRPNLVQWCSQPHLWPPSVAAQGSPTAN